MVSVSEFLAEEKPRIPDFLAGKNGDLFDGVSKEMVGMFVQDMLQHEEGTEAPDTTGAEFFFLRDFFTDDMEYDFPLIEQEFLRHCYGRLAEFELAAWYEKSRPPGTPTA